VTAPHLTASELSALIDGDSDVGPRSHIESCRSCEERLQTWRRSLGRLADVPVPPDLREQAVGAALASAAAPADGVEGPNAAKRRRHPGPVAWAAAAAMVVAGAGFGLSQLSGPVHHSAATSASTSPVVRGGASEGAAASTGGPPSAGSGGSEGSGSAVAGSASASNSPAPAAPAADLGVVAGPAALVRVVDAALAGKQAVLGPSQGAAAPDSASGACPVPAGLFPAGDVPVRVLVASAVYQGRPATVAVWQAGGARRAVVFEGSRCALLAEVEV
jgi:hypothetical protein